MAPDMELEPRYSTREIPGRCIKCLAEEQYRDCFRQLLKGGRENEELRETYEAVVALLKSPELQKLRDESERHLAEGRDVKVVLHLGEGEPRYEIKVC
ncbi:MAG: hypothetical protein AMJ77_06135 [Dehalococcoidia bacterium SM23_28_2]|nr:MAG: hypothetical protein AMJ77_06135 [Dehalococcoidia bacterium SM23_28_2]